MLYNQLLASIAFRKSSRKYRVVTADIRVQLHENYYIERYRFSKPSTLYIRASSTLKQYIELAVATSRYYDILEVSTNRSSFHCRLPQLLLQLILPTSL